MFTVRMALREVRASWHRLAFFFVCLAVGVAAIVAIRSVVQQVRTALTAQARTLTGADVVLASDRPFSAHVRATVAGERAAGRVLTASEATELATMVRPAQGVRATRMVELRGVDAAFPLYGSLTLRDGVYAHSLLRDHGALVRPELLAQLGIAVGDALMIGNARFDVRGVIKEEPGRSLGSFSLGSRVIVDAVDLPSTGLLAFGSRVNHQWLLRVTPSSVPSIGDRLGTAFANEFVRVRGYWQNEDRIGENLSRAEDYLSLVGLIVLVLGGIGVASVMRVFIDQKMRSIAILRCLGCTARQVIGTYLLQVVLLGFAGSVAGVLIAGCGIALLPHVAGDLTALLDRPLTLTAGAVLQGLAVGLLIAVLFSLVPLLDARHVKPVRLLRHEAPKAGGIDRLKWGAALATIAALVAVAAWQAGSWRVALVLAGGLATTGMLLHLAGRGLIRAVQPLAASRVFGVRHAVLRLGRPGNQTRAILLAVGLGCFFIVGVRSLQASLLQDFALQDASDAPDMFLIDIQPMQRAGVVALVDRDNGIEPAPHVMPTLRARVVAVRGREIRLESLAAVRGRGGLSREYTVTYRSNLEPNERLVAGRWWGAGRVSGLPEVSIEESLRDRFRIQVGDEIRVDVLGRTIAARVASVRAVDWRDFRSGGFMLVFQPGTFDGAPHTFIATARGPAAPEARARMQAALVERFPNVSVIDVREVMETVGVIVRNVTLGVTIVGGLVLFAGVLILAGAISMTRYQRIYETAILKTLGAGRRVIGQTLLIEYGLLGAMAGAVGSLAAMALSYVVARYVLMLAWAPDVWLLMAGVAGGASLVAGVGLMASLEVLRQKPLGPLRAE